MGLCANDRTYRNYQYQAQHASGLVCNPYVWTRYGIWDARGFRRRGDTTTTPQSAAAFNQPLVNRPYCGC